MPQISFELLFTESANRDLDKLENEPSLLKRLKAVRKTLAYLQTNPRHPSLNTHKYSSIRGENNEEIFEAYVEDNAPAAYRIFWGYGPKKRQITIYAITQHP